MYCIFSIAHVVDPRISPQLKGKGTYEVGCVNPRLADQNPLKIRTFHEKAGGAKCRMSLARSLLPT